MQSKIFSFTFILFAWLSLQSCTSSKPIDKNEQWSLELKKGGCLDVCKAYSIQIKNTGEYDYNGKFKVKHRGKKTGRIHQQNLTELKTLVSNINWKELKSSYDKPALDSQKNEINYISKSLRKAITYSRMEPQELRKLENFINTLIDQDDF